MVQIPIVLTEVVHSRVIEGKVKMNIFTIYNIGKVKDIEETFKKIEDRCEGEGIIIGDFNIKNRYKELLPLLGKLEGEEVERYETVRKR